MRLYSKCSVCEFESHSGYFLKAMGLTMKPQLINQFRRCAFTFNESQNGGEQVILQTIISQSGDEVTLIQKLSMQSYSNAVTLDLYGIFTPENLRAAADQIESEIAGFQKSNEPKNA